MTTTLPEPEDFSKAVDNFRNLLVAIFGEELADDHVPGDPATIDHSPRP